MTIGLLCCDHIPSHLQGYQGDYDEMYGALLPGMDVKPYYVCDGIFPSDINECDSWLIGGSRSSAYEDKPWIQNLLSLTREILQNQIPLIGICFGHQLIALAAGGEVRRSEGGWTLGNYEFEILKHPSHAEFTNGQFRMLMLCQDQVTKLPDQASLFASNNRCPNAGYLLSDHCISMQGHPEFTSSYLKGVINDRKGMIPDDVTRVALNSLSLDTDHREISQWLISFLKAN